MSIMASIGHDNAKNIITSTRHLGISSDSDSDGDGGGQACSNCSIEEDGLECPLCCEGFNSIHHLPYVLWCGHSICKRCLLDLHWATVRLPITPIQLPLFIACPWCQSLSCRLVWKGKLKYPCKNFFLLWLVESMKSDNVKENSVKADISTRKSGKEDDKAMGVQHLHQQNYSGVSQQVSFYNGFSSSSSLSSSLILPILPQSHSRVFFFRGFLTKVVRFCAQLMAKFISLVIVLFLLFCVLPISLIILVVYFGATLFIAFPSFLVVYFAFPSLSWLLREIIT